MDPPEINQHITDRQRELRALTPEPIEHTVNAPKWYHNSQAFWEKARQCIGKHREQSTTWENQGREQ